MYIYIYNIIQYKLIYKHGLFTKVSIYKYIYNYAQRICLNDTLKRAELRRELRSAAQSCAQLARNSCAVLSQHLRNVFPSVSQLFPTCSHLVCIQDKTILLFVYIYNEWFKKDIKYTKYMKYTIYIYKIYEIHIRKIQSLQKSQTMNYENYRYNKIGVWKC